MSTGDGSEAAREARARRAAKRRGLRLHRSRRRLGSIDNPGGFQIVNSYYNFVVAGERFDMTLDDVEQWLRRIPG